MLSRRSRLKAIANLPVRRKPAGSEISNDILCNSTVAEKTPTPVTGQVVPSGVDSDSPKTSEAEDLGNNITQENEKESSQSFNCNEDLKTQESINNIIYCTNQECEKNINLINECSNNYSVNNNNNNSNDFNSNNSLNTGKKICDNSYKINKFRANLFSSTVKEREHCESFREQIKESTKEFEACNVDDNQVIDCTISSDLDENVKCYTVLTPINIPNSNFTIAPLTPCDTYDDSLSKESDLNPIIESYEEIQIYTELEGATDLYVNTPKVCNSNNENNDFQIDYVQSNSLLPSVVNGSNEKKGLSFKSTPKNVSLNGNVNTSDNEVLGKNSTPHTKNKDSNLESENSIITNSQNMNFDNLDSSSVIFKKSKTLGRKWSKCNDFTKKLSDAKREFQKKYEKRKPDRSTLKMIDLIFYNPSTNPMESKSKVEKLETISESSDLIEGMQQEEEIDDPEVVDSSSELSMSNNNDSENVKKMPVPQVKIGLNGEIILDEQSLVIETTSAKKGREDLQNSIPVFEDKGHRVPYYGGKARKSREWTDFETKRFYKALNTIGPDFSLMQKYFPGRSRLELKNKFKREERLNRNLIDRALNNPSEFDMTQLENDLAVEKRAEEAAEMRLCMVRDRRAPRKKKVKVRIRSSQLSREMVHSEEESEDSLRQSNALSCKKLSQSEKNKKQKEINFIFKKIVLQNSESEPK